MPIQKVFRLATEDETWLHHWDPDAKEISYPTISRQGNGLVSKGIILIDYKPAGTQLQENTMPMPLNNLGLLLKEK